MCFIINPSLHFSGHLAEIIWRNHHSGNHLQSLFQLLTLIYDVQNKDIGLNYIEDSLFSSINLKRSKIYSTVGSVSVCMKY